MDELYRRALILMRGMWKYRLIGLIAAWVVGIIGVGLVMVVPDRYEATARIFINTDSIIKPLMQGMAVQPNVDQRIDMLSKVVMSRPNIEKLIHMVGLDADNPPKAKYESIVDDVTKVLQIKPSGGNNQYTLTYRARDPDSAKRMVEAMLSTFVESGQGARNSDTDAAKKFLDEQIAVYEKKLSEAENRVKEFKLKNLGMTPGEGGGYFGRMSETSNLLSQAQLELREAENSRDAFKQQLASAEANQPPSVGPSAPDAAAKSISDIDARLDGLRRNLDVLLQRFTDSHPDVAGTRRAIRDLEEQKARLIASVRPTTGSATLPSYSADGMRAIETMKVSLANAEARVASLRARVAEYSARVNNLKDMARLMPQLEAESAQLNRDYDVNKKNYESLVTRREQAGLSGEMQAVSGVADFRLIDPPRASPRPVSPNRLLLLPMALLVALGAGLGAAFAAAELRPTFYDARTLRETTGLPILGVVSMISNEARRRTLRASAVRFMAGVGALFGAYAASFAVVLLLTARTAQVVQ